jgi:protein-S-isoprenylcysteine O-methyltransferase Ste14
MSFATPNWNALKPSAERSRYQTPLRNTAISVLPSPGTISPLDPTKELVVRGLYRYSRNPMYVGAMTLLAGEAIFWWSSAVAVYAAVVFIAFNLFILLHEEPRLERAFPGQYGEYRRRVRRWF